MEPKIETMMDLIEDSIEGYFYDVISNYEISLDRKDGWRLRKYQSEDLWKTFNQSNIIDNFNLYQIDLRTFQILLVHSIQNMGVYYDNQITKIKKLLGDEVIKESQKAWEDFAVSLSKIIEKDTRLKNIKLVNTTEEYLQRTDKL